jgi:hypothetical protein
MYRTVVQCTLFIYLNVRKSESFIIMNKSKIIILCTLSAYLSVCMNVRKYKSFIIVDEGRIVILCILSIYLSICLYIQSVGHCFLCGRTRP